MTDPTLGSGPTGPRPGGPKPSAPKPSSPRPGITTMTPARRDPMEARSVAFPSAVATTGGPVTFSLPSSRGMPCFAEGEHRLVGHVWPGTQEIADRINALVRGTAQP